MKKLRKIQKGLAIILCICMVCGMTPLSVRAEDFTDGVATEAEGTDSGIACFSEEEADTGTGVSYESQDSTAGSATEETEAGTTASSEAKNSTAGKAGTGTTAKSESKSSTTGKAGTGTTAKSRSKSSTASKKDTSIDNSIHSQDSVEEDDTDENSGSQDVVAAVQEQIDALPDAEDITEDNMDEVIAQLDAIDEAKSALTEEQSDRLDLTRYDEAAEAVMTLMGMDSAGEPATMESIPTKTVHYIGANGADASALAEIVSSQYYQNQTVKWTSNQERCFVVEGNITIQGLIEVTGTVRLILADGATLNAQRGIKVSSGNNLYIYSQSGNSGKLIAGAAYGSAIGGTQYGTSVGTDNINQPGAGNIYIFGGNITAETTAEEAAAIGGARGGQGGSVTICGGNVTAKSKYGDGIGGGASFSTDYNGRKGSATIDANSITGGKLSEWNGVIYINKVRTLRGNTLLEQNPSVPEGYTLYLPKTETLTIPENVSLELKGTLVADGSVINNGTLTNSADFTEKGIFTNNGTFTNNNNAVFHKTFSNADGAEINNEKGSVTINSSLMNKGTITNASYATFTVGEKGSLDNQGTFTSSGTVQNDGSFANSGTYSGTNHPLINNNTLTNDGDLTSGTITNKQGATFTNEKEHKVTSKQFDNDGKIVNNGAFENSSGYTQRVSNAGEFLNNNSMNVSYIRNSGTFVNKQTVTVSEVITNSGTFTNDGTFTGDSMVWNGGKFINRSTCTVDSMNNGKASFNGEIKADAVIENSGTVNVSRTVTNYASIQNRGSITVNHNVVVKEGSSCSGVPIHLAKREVSYIQEDGSTKTETLEYDLPGTTLDSGTYLLDSELPSLTVSGEVTLILTGDSTIKKNITVNEGSTLKLYTASDSTHTLQAADIDGSGEVIVNSSKAAVSGKISQITVNNGELTAGSITNLTVKNGTVSADNIVQATVSGGRVKANKKIDEITVNNGEVTADSITTVKAGRGIIHASTIDKATGMADNSSVIFADTISDTSNFKGIAFIGDTGRMYGVTSLTLRTDFTVPGGKTFIVPAGKSLFIPNGTVLTYAGIINIEESAILYKVQDSCLKKEGNGQIIGTITENIKESLITYVMPDGTTDEKFAKSVTEETTQLATPEGDSEAWYVLLKDISLSGRLNIQGNVNLILADGFNLNVLKGGICVPAGSSLTIYGQNAGTGKLTAKGSSDLAGIGGSDGDGSYGTITINGGTIEATGGSRGAGIGGGNNNTTEGSSAKSGKVIINGGNVTAIGGYNGAGIGGGQYCRGDVEVNGGTVKATGGRYGAGIGGGYWSCYYNDEGYDGRSIIHINGGEVTAKPGDDGAGIGSGRMGSAEITISGGKVNAEDSGVDGSGAAIGAGDNSKGEHCIRITGGEVIVKASKTIGIGCMFDRYNKPPRDTIVVIEGGTVNISCELNAGIYCSLYSTTSSIAISGGEVTIETASAVGILSKKISISGGLVDARSSNSLSAGIGRDDSDITISGGIVRAANQSTMERNGENNAIKANQLTLNGDAVIYTSNNFSSQPLINATTTEFSSGILFESTNGSVYGNPIPGSSWEVPADSTLTIENGQTVTVPADVTLVNKGQIVIKSGGHLTVKGTLDTENGTITNAGTIQSVGGTLKGENKIANSTGGIIMRVTELAVTAGTKGKVTYGSPYEVSYKLKDGTKAPEVKEGTYQEKYTDADGTVLTEKPGNAGQYTVTVSYQTNDGRTCEGSVGFTITQATPEIGWLDKEKEQSAIYTGKEIDAAKIIAPTVTLQKEETYQDTDKITYSYRKIADDTSDGEFTSGLPTEIGTYEIKAAIPAGGNYTAAETKETMTLTIICTHVDEKGTDNEGKETDQPDGICDLCGKELKDLEHLEKLITTVTDNLNNSEGQYAGAQYTTSSIENLRQALKAAKSMTKDNTESEIAAAYDKLLAASYIGDNGLKKADKNIVIAFPHETDRGVKEGHGWYANGDTVTLKVVPRAGYSFSKWTTDTSGNNQIEAAGNTYTFTLEQDSLETYYAWLSEIKYEVKFVDAEGGSASANKTGYVYGEKAKVTATPSENYVFAGWRDAYGITVSTDAIYEFTVLGNVTLTPEFVKTQNDAGDSISYVTVNFYHQSGHLLSSQKVVSGTAIGTVDVSIPTKVGFDFAGWSTVKNGASQDDVINLETQNFSEDTNLYPVFIAQDITYKLTVNGNEETKAPQSLVTVTADPITGKQFVGWKDEHGNIVSYDSTYTFVITGDTILTAYYEMAGGIVEKEPTITMSEPTYEEGRDVYKMTFYFNYTLPDDCTLIDLGIIRKEGDYTSKGISFETEDISQYSVLSKLGIDGQFYYTKANYYGTGHTVTGYMIYEKNGTRYTVYSNSFYGIKNN